MESIEGDHLRPVPAPKMSVILHLQNGVTQTASCVSALAAETPDAVAFETLIIDDATTDQTAQFLEGLSGDLTVIRNDVAAGFPTGVNRALELALAPFVVLLDQFTTVTAGWLEPLLARLESDPGLGALQPLVVDPDGRLWSAGAHLGADGRPLLRGHGHLSPSAPEWQTAGPLELLDGTCVVARKAAVMEAGGFDRAFPSGIARAADMSIALQRAGWTIAYEPRSSVVHVRDPEIHAGSRRFVAKWGKPTSHRRPKTIAFYLPVFYPIPENNRWWGPGFTEWNNVAKAVPHFDGHEQPHLPADLGFTDLRLEETRIAQADLARSHGVDAFCYYHYWFNGRQLLQRPFDEVRSSGRPDFPFCLCWANEDWRSTRGGHTGDILDGQQYSEADDDAHIEWLLPVFADKRYLRVDGKPLFLVYRASQLPDPARTTGLWRDAARRAGTGELYLCRVESFDDERDDPRLIGFDASVEFAPDWEVLPGLESVPTQRDTVYRYSDLARSMSDKPPPEWRRIPGVTPRWDNTARRPSNALIFDGSSPELYGAWISSVSARELVAEQSDPLVFVNAWNEWGRGTHLEPCQRWGRRYLEAHRDAIGAAVAPVQTDSVGVCVTGMHRSGTSMTASWLERCGLPVHGGQVMGAAEGNIKGHFEDLEFMRINELAIGRRWPTADGWKVIEDLPCHLEEPELSAARQLVDRRMRTFEHWAWKDPRSTLLLESWADVVPGMRALLLWRPCEQVVDSLLRRSAETDNSLAQIDRDRAVGAWIAYNRRVVEYRRLYPQDTALIPTASVVASPEETFALLCERFRLPLRYYPLEDLFDPSQLASGGVADLGNRRSEVVALEAELAELSDCEPT